MIWGVISDTHKDEMNAIPHIMAEFQKRNVELIIHCGDIEPQHLKAELFGDLPVICALIKEQVDRPEFKTPPKNWVFTKPKERICSIDNEPVYIGHKRSFMFLTGSEANLIRFLNELRYKHDGVNWLFSGHTHHQIFQQGQIDFINPGAVEYSFDGYEFAVVNTETDEIVFSRIPRTKPIKETFSVGVISDSLDISELDTQFWGRLTKEFEKRDVSHIIHCGNIAIEDIGLKELSDFQVHYNLRQDQHRKLKKEPDTPKNWHLIPQDYPVVEINGYRFYVQLDLAIDLLDRSEPEIHRLCLEIRRTHPNISFALCGFTRDAFYQEGEQIRIINPGDVNKDRNIVVICLPRAEITFGHVPVDPLPPIEQ